MKGSSFWNWDEISYCWPENFMKKLMLLAKDLSWTYIGMKYSILCEKLSRSKSLPLVKMFLEVDAQSILTIQVYIVEECEIVYTEKTKTSALAYVKIERPAKKEIKSHQTRNNPLRPCL